jgi:hypothetical protein
LTGTKRKSGQFEPCRILDSSIAFVSKHVSLLILFVVILYHTAMRNQQ